MELTGTLKVKRDEQKVNDRFRKREFVLSVDDNGYIQYISFNCTQDKCDLLNSISEGDTITVSFNIRGREWKSPQGEIKYFNSLEAWKINRGENTPPIPPPFDENKTITAPSGASDDLPF